MFQISRFHKENLRKIKVFQGFQGPPFKFQAIQGFQGPVETLD